MYTKIIITVIILVVIVAIALAIDWSRLFSSSNLPNIQEEIEQIDPSEILNKNQNQNSSQDSSKDQLINNSNEQVKIIQITGTNFVFSPNEIRIKKGDQVRIIFTSNEGFHDWVIDVFNAATERVQSGQTTEIVFIADRAGSFEYYCSVGNHRAQGMVGTLIVEE
ncbi:hypothetical protein CO172_01470 [Candidatus Uhrbacteria bacterium CG_4_9_14_3_um_filter_36_7]|uniref:EfeO-type cupredoxin-like domain-containing protein n=1 Tax=Candidatus Uhrbacteria bacterium CG_4_9_14_3_um_filter_36_7 TaxID=1975033 RepID=A0A2M7XHQ8_9BACT|nr:MAG: hypothetical protein CO172_01470 [Candidatus Uhrbacteria bacterium CG_4_9_14_3_um_filter_36_7]